MKIKHHSIKSVLAQISQNSLFLPPIQRNFVWSQDRIENYFDSVVSGYPLGSFVFWKLNNETAQKYPLYNFIKSYNEYKETPNTLAERNLFHKDIYAVVDGQQRLSSLFIGLKGKYTYKKEGRGRHNSPDDFETTKLYFNLFHVNKRFEEEEINQTAFSFLTDDKSSNLNDRHLWFEVGRVITWNNITDVNNAFNEIESSIKLSKKKTVIQKFETKREFILDRLISFFKIFNDKIISYYEIHSDSIDEILEIFVRINSGGMELEKSELLFSTLVSEWHAGRDEVDEMVDYLNEKNLDIDRGFIMRSCLMLCDLPVKYKLETFNKKNIRKIKSNWPGIKSTLIKMGDFLPYIGFNGDYRLMSYNALLPMIYYVYKNGDIKSLRTIKEIRRYFIISQVKGIYGGTPESILTKSRDILREKGSNGSYVLKKEKFDFSDFTSADMPSGKSFSVDIDFINNELVDTEYPSPKAYYLLSLIYPNVDFEREKYDMDHIQPKSKFKYETLKRLNIPKSKSDEWIEIRNCLPNLQLLTKQENREKKKSLTLKQYLSEKTSTQKRRFIDDNLIPRESWYHDLKNFEEFYQKRKRELVKRLKKELILS